MEERKEWNGMKEWRWKEMDLEEKISLLMKNIEAGIMAEVPFTGSMSRGIAQKN